MIGLDDSVGEQDEQTTAVEAPPRMAPRLREYEPPVSQPLGQGRGSLKPDEMYAWKQDQEEARLIIQVCKKSPQSSPD